MLTINKMFLMVLALACFCSADVAKGKGLSHISVENPHGETYHFEIEHRHDGPTFGKTDPGSYEESPSSDAIGVSGHADSPDPDHKPVQHDDHEPSHEGDEHTFFDHKVLGYGDFVDAPHDDHYSDDYVFKGFDIDEDKIKDSGHAHDKTSGSFGVGNYANDYGHYGNVNGFDGGKGYKYGSYDVHEKKKPKGFSGYGKGGYGYGGSGHTGYFKGLGGSSSGHGGFGLSGYGGKGYSHGGYGHGYGHAGYGHGGHGHGGYSHGGYGSAVYGHGDHGHGGYGNKGYGHGGYGHGGYGHGGYGHSGYGHGGYGHDGYGHSGYGHDGYGHGGYGQGGYGNGGYGHRGYGHGYGHGSYEDGSYGYRTYGNKGPDHDTGLKDYSSDGLGDGHGFGYSHITINHPSFSHSNKPNHKYVSDGHVHNGGHDHRYKDGNRYGLSRYGQGQGSIHNHGGEDGYSHDDDGQYVSKHSPKGYSYKYSKVYKGKPTNKWSFNYGEYEESYSSPGRHVELHTEGHTGDSDKHH